MPSFLNGKICFTYIDLIVDIIFYNIDVCQKMAPFYKSTKLVESRNAAWRLCGCFPGVVGFEPTKCRSQSPVPYHLATRHGCGNKIRTYTTRVKVSRATVTQCRKICFGSIQSPKITCGTSALLERFYHHRQDQPFALPKAHCVEVVGCASCGEWIRTTDF